MKTCVQRSLDASYVPGAALNLSNNAQGDHSFACPPPILPEDPRLSEDLKEWIVQAGLWELWSWVRMDNRKL